MTTSVHPSRLDLTISLILVVALVLAGTGFRSSPRAADTMTTLPGHRPPLVLRSRAVARAAPQESIRLALALPVFNQAALTDYLQHLYTPGDPLYGQYLTPETFTQRFSPSEADYEALAAYARSNGLSIVGKHSNRLLLDVAGPISAVEKAFGTRLFQYQAPNGRVFRASETDPVVPAAIASHLAGVIGLDTAGVWRPHNRRRPVDAGNRRSHSVHPHGGNGPGGGLSPQNIKTAYNLTGTTLTGAGQVLALFELDGYDPSDISGYEQQFSLPAVPLENVFVDGADGFPGPAADEVTLDIELMIALAPGASKIIVYEGGNTDASVVDTYSKIATENRAKQVSTSWGLDETSTGATTRNAENAIFQQMAAQGQTIYSASGDFGAYDDGSTISVDDPSSQSYMTAVGGTTLTTGTGAAYISETTWNAGSSAAGAGGGGVSQYWPIPSYQQGVVSTASKGSTSFRNVPDVALDADTDTGYSIYYNGSWAVYGGTSCAAPLWAGFTALVNQQRLANGNSSLGFANPLLYTLGKGVHYTTDFHDIADNSTNLFYPAVTGYDDATGWGSFNGANLIADLSSGGVGSGTQILGNPGFENGAKSSPWVASAGVINSASGEAAHGGVWKAWLDGRGHTHTDVLYQNVAIPSTITTATFSFWLHVDSEEISGHTGYDTLTVQVRTPSGAVLKTLAVYSNLDAEQGYSLRSFDLSAYKGKTIQLFFNGTERYTRQTSFVIDDVALNVQ